MPEWMVRKSEFDRAQAAIDRERVFPRQIVTTLHPRGEAYATMVGWQGEVVQEEVEMTVVQRLQAFDSNRADVHDMLDLLASANGVKQAYYETGVPIPEPLVSGVESLRANIETHKRDAIQKRRKEIAAQRTGLLSAQEKRAALDAEDAALEAALGIAKEPVTA